MPITFTTAKTISVATTSYSQSGKSSVSLLLSLLANTSSHSSQTDSTSSRSGVGYGRATSSESSTLSTEIEVFLTLLLNAKSSSATLSSSSSRGAFNGGRDIDSRLNASSSDSEALISLTVGAESYFKKAVSFSYNERTSLEVIDFTVSWNDSGLYWVTNWFQEEQILGNEDTLAIRSLVVDGAKEPCALIEVQYDGNGDGQVDEVSEIIRVEDDENVKDVKGVPVDTDGYYRLRIMEYSGYNSIYNINAGIIH